MVAPRAGGYRFRMTTTTAASSIDTPAGAGGVSPDSLRSPNGPSVRPVLGEAPGRGLAALAALLLAVFGAFSMWVVGTQGYFGFIELAGRERWALQMLIDLVIALSFAVGWMVTDARKRGIASWPYVVVTVVLGSIGVLAYCVRRALAPITRRPGT
jgi:hypothetical protein